jgi:hypothetical protein
MGTHRGSGATTGRRGQLRTVVFWWRAAPAIIDECGKVLQLEGDKGVRKCRLIEETRGSRRPSLTNGGRQSGSGGIPCGLMSSGYWRWTGGGEGCRASSCGRGRGEKMGKRRGCGGRDDRFKPARRGGGRPVGWHHMVGEG